jgi:hypothetical protein
MLDQEQDPIDRIYAYSEESIMHNAKMYCEEHNYEILF